MLENIWKQNESRFQTSAKQQALRFEFERGAAAAREYRVVTVIVLVPVTVGLKEVEHLVQGQGRCGWLICGIVRIK